MKINVKKHTADQSNNKVVQKYVRAASQHVVPSSDGWKVKKSGAQRATKVFELKKDAIDHAKKVARNQHAELFIHGKKGKIQQRKKLRAK